MHLHPELRFDEEKLLSVARTIVGPSLEIGHTDILSIVYNPGAEQLVRQVTGLAIGLGARVMPLCEDPIADAKFLEQVVNGRTSFNERVKDRTENADSATKFAGIGVDLDVEVAYALVPHGLREAFNDAQADLRKIRREKRWVLTYLPTPEEAKLDGIPYEDYKDLFLNACDQDWEAIKIAQDILIEEILNPAKSLQFRAQDTDLMMSIDGQTFANSTILRNIPGSEVFTGPQRYTTQRTLTLPYRVMFDGKMLPNLILRVDQGKVVGFETEGQDNRRFIQEIFDNDPGTTEIGEIAFGTNSALTRPYLNGLLVEKVSGSFHLALGRAYTDTIYAGKPVRVFNGVEAKKHIDLTRVMLSQYGGGETWVDGMLIQKDGVFLDPRLIILNPK